MARTTLKLVGRAVLVSWLMYVITAASIILLMWLSGTLPQSTVFDKFRSAGVASTDPLVGLIACWWYWPATLLSFWISVSITSTMMLTGRSRFWATILCAGFAFFVLTVILFKLVDREWEILWSGFLRSSVGLGSASLTGWVMVVACRQKAVSSQSMLASLVAWIAIGAVVIGESRHIPGLTASVAILIIGVASFAFLPLAGATMAIAWNRHR